jgi:glycosyltransferase involved in cell wall biosynthesis
METVSIIIPTYNCAAYLSDAIGSALLQSAVPMEVIVVDDGSTDSTPDVIRRFEGKVTYMRQDNAGVSAARNAGLQRAAGDWVAFLDSDDRLPPGALQDLLSSARGREDVIVYGDRYEIDENGEQLGRYSSRDCTGYPPAGARGHFGGAAFQPGSAIVPRKLAVEIGGFDIRFSTCADRHFWIRCGAVAEFIYSGTTVYEYRVRANSMSSNLAAHAVESVAVRLDALDWCRQRGISVYDVEPAPEEILYADLASLYWSRQWSCVDALLKFASQRGISSPRLADIRRRRRFGPWIFSVKDRLDRVWHQRNG